MDITVLQELKIFKKFKITIVLIINISNMEVCNEPVCL
jgi:hypothetical protein